MRSERSSGLIRIASYLDLHAVLAAAPRPMLFWMTAPTYVREKAWVAVHCLAVSDEPLPERLANAWISALSRLQHPADDWGTIPGEVTEIYQRIQDRLDQPSPDGRTAGAVAAARSLSPDEARQVADEILDLHSAAGPL